MEREKFIHGFILQMPAMAGAHQAKARSWELSLGLPWACLAPMYVSRHLPPSRMFISGKLQLGVQPSLELRCLYRRCRHTHWQLNCYTKHPSPFICHADVSISIESRIFIFFFAQSSLLIADLYWWIPDVFMLAILSISLLFSASF